MCQFLTLFSLTAPVFDPSDFGSAPARLLDVLFWEMKKAEVPYATPGACLCIELAACGPAPESRRI